MREYRRRSREAGLNIAWYAHARSRWWPPTLGKVCAMDDSGKGTSRIGPEWRAGAFFVPLFDSWRAVMQNRAAQLWTAVSAVIAYAVDDLFMPIFIVLGIAMYFALRATRRADLFDARQLYVDVHQAHAVQNAEIRASNLLSANISMLGMLMVFRVVEYWADTQGLLGVFAIANMRPGTISTIACAVSLWQVLTTWRTALRRLGQDVPFWPILEALVKRIPRPAWWSSQEEKEQRLDERRQRKRDKS